jgi:hypothetical protein
MPLVSKSIPNLINGISQQPQTLRLPSQCEDQVNGFSSVVEGLKKRPPLDYVAKISSSTATDNFLHIINRDSTEQYIVTITNGAIQVNSVDGTAQTVTTPNGTSYLTATNPSSAFRCVTIADYTFILNKNITTAKGSTTSSGGGTFQALYTVKQGVAETNYKVTLDGTDFSLTTTDVASNYKTDTIASNMATLITAGGYTVTNFGSTLHIEKASDFTATSTDGFGDSASQMVKDKVQNFINLPKKSKNGHVLEVTNSASNGFDNYYVVFETDATNPAEGVWKETVKAGLIVDFDPSTMPHQLVRNANGTFTFDRTSWGNRIAGDEDSAPDPTFIGKKINDIYFHRNRLGFLSDEAVIMSRSSDFFDFYPETVTSILATDPIDIQVSHTKVSLLRYAIPFDEELLIFSDQTQFIVAGRQTISPQTATANVSSEYESTTTVPPVGSGKNVFFAFKRGDYSGVREYFVSADSDVKEAEDITGNVPKYLPTNIKRFASATNDGILVALDNTGSRLYVYQYYYTQTEKLQSAWHSWTFTKSDDPTTVILDAGFLENYLYLVIKKLDGTYIGKINIAPNPVDTGANYTTHLDYRAIESACTLSYDAVSNKTTIIMPFPKETTLQVVTRGFNGGTVIPITDESLSSTIIKVAGDHTATSFFVGEVYEFRYQFSTQFFKGPDGPSVKEGRLQLRNMSLGYDKTGFFKTEVTPYRRATSNDTFSAPVGTAVAGQINLDSGDFKFTIQSHNEKVNISLINDSFQPSTFINAEWEAWWHQRGRSI